MRGIKGVYLFTLLLLFSLALAQGEGEKGLKPATGLLCSLFTSILPIVVVIGIVLSGITFAAGQVMGAETRARANVWATNLLIGSLIAGVITVLAPSFVENMTGFTLSNCKAAAGGGFCSQGYFPCGDHCCAQGETCYDGQCYNCGDDECICNNDGDISCVDSKECTNNGGSCVG